MNTTLDPRVKDQISLYIAEALDQGIKFETKNYDGWCREITLKYWDSTISEYRNGLWISVYIADTNRLKVEASWLGYNGHKIAKRDIVDYIGQVKYLEDTINAKVA